MNTIIQTIRAANEALAESRKPDMEFLRHCVDSLAQAKDERAESAVDDIVSVLEERGFLDEADTLTTAYVAAE
mgnify:CR=1 FL=1